MKKMTFTQKIWHKIKGLPFYSKALLIALPFTCALLAYLLSIGAADLIFSDWFIALLSIPTLVANQLSSAAYFGRITDLFSDFKHTVKAHRNELIGTLIGMSTGIAIGIGLAIMHVTIPLASSLYAFATVLFTLRQMNIFAGLGNRIGRCTDKDSRPFSEKAIVAAAGIFGLTLGIVLFATCTAAMVSVVGLTSFFSGGAAIPAWIAGIIFVLSVSSGFASTADYVSKGVSFIRSTFILEKMETTLLDEEQKMVAKTVKERRYEYGNSLVGVGIGITVGASIVAALILTNPLLLTGLVGAVASLLIVVTAAGIIGSICSRGGRLIDGFRKKDEPIVSIELKPSLKRKHIEIVNDSTPFPLEKRRKLEHVKVTTSQDCLFSRPKTPPTKIDDELRPLLTRRRGFTLNKNQE